MHGIFSWILVAVACRLETFSKCSSFIFTALFLSFKLATAVKPRACSSCQNCPACRTFSTEQRGKWSVAHTAQPRVKAGLCSMCSPDCASAVVLWYVKQKLKLLKLVIKHPGFFVRDSCNNWQSHCLPLAQPPNSLRSSGRMATPLLQRAARETTLRGWLISLCPTKKEVINTGKKKKENKRERK